MSDNQVETPVTNEIPKEMTDSMYLSEPSSDTEKINDDGLRRRRRTNTESNVGEETSQTVVESVLEQVDEVVTSSENNDNQVVEQEEAQTAEVNDVAAEEAEESEEEEAEEEDEAEESEEEEAEESEEEEDDESEDNKAVHYIQTIVVKERENDFPWQITCVASMMIVMYIFKLFLFLCALTGCTCNGRCVCMP
jgi:hypothetical protein